MTIATRFSKAQTVNQRPLRIYIHIPYCIHKCHYCDFNSHVRREIDWEGWLRAVRAELMHRAVPHCSVASIFFGGGTPSLAPVFVIDGVLQWIAQLFSLQSDAEITMEANPGTVDASRFQGYYDAGVNRLSIGVQSLDAVELQWLERIHTPAQAVAAFELARGVGFDNISMDLMYGLPDQSLTLWQSSLEQAVMMQPEHLSCYQLTVEPQTRLAAMHANNPDMGWPKESLASDFFQSTRDYLVEHNYLPYEISNHAKEGRHCHHNDGYWRYDDYIGIGPGAAGKINQADGGVYRYGNIRSPEKYIAAAMEGKYLLAYEESLSQEEAAREAFWLGLRRQRGVNHGDFCLRFNDVLLQQQQYACRSWQKSGHLLTDNHATRIAAKGWLLADAIAASVFA